MNVLVDCKMGNIENYIKTRTEKLKDPKMLPIGTKNQHSYPILDNVFSSFHYSYGNDGDHLQDHHYLSESSSVSLLVTHKIRDQIYIP